MTSSALQARLARDRAQAWRNWAGFLTANSIGAALMTALWIY